MWQSQPQARGMLAGGKTEHNMCRASRQPRCREWFSEELQRRTCQMAPRKGQVGVCYKGNIPDVTDQEPEEVLQTQRGWGSDLAAVHANRGKGQLWCGAV